MRGRVGVCTNGSNTHPLMPRVTPLFARFSRGLVVGAFNLGLHLAMTSICTAALL